MNHQVQHTTSTLQNRTAAIAAFFMTLFLLCIEHVRAFANQYQLSTHDVMVLGSAASSLSRKIIGNGIDEVRGLKQSVSFLGLSSRTASSTGSNARNGEGSTTKLSMAWSIPAISLPTMPTLTSKDWPVHALGSWYEKVDPTNTLPVYDDEYENAYSYTTDDWPSITDSINDRTSSQPQSPVVTRRRPRPFKAIRHAAGRFVDGVVRFPHSQ